MGELLKGKPVADAMKEDLINRVNALKERGITPKLGIMRVGARPDDLFMKAAPKKPAIPWAWLTRFLNTLRMLARKLLKKQSWR